MTYLHLPIPSWYFSYLSLNKGLFFSEEESSFPGEPLEIKLEGDSDFLPGVLYPRIQVSNLADQEKLGDVYMQYMQRKAPIISRSKLSFVENPKGILSFMRYGAMDGFQGMSSGIVSLSPLLGFVSKSEGRGSTKSVDHITRVGNLLPSKNDLIDDERFYSLMSEIPNESGIRMKQAMSNHAASPLPRLGPIDLDRDPITSEEAGYILRKIINNDEMFDSIVNQLSKSKASKDPFSERGCQWKDNCTISIAANWAFYFSADEEALKAFDINWSWIGGLIADVRDVYDIWIKESELLSDLD